MLTLVRPSDDGSAAAAARRREMSSALTDRNPIPLSQLQQLLLELTQPLPLLPMRHRRQHTSRLRLVHMRMQRGGDLAQRRPALARAEGVEGVEGGGGGGWRARGWEDGEAAVAADGVGDGGVEVGGDGGGGGAGYGVAVRVCVGAVAAVGLVGVSCELERYGLRRRARWRLRMGERCSGCAD